MEIRPGMFASSVATNDWVPDPVMAGAEMHELVHDDAVWAGLLRVVDADASGTMTYASRDTWIVLDGTCRLEFDDGSARTLGPGDIISVPPGTRVTWHITAPYREMWIITGP
jgi:uncharacterized cupin superfamily protein